MSASWIIAAVLWVVGVPVAIASIARFKVARSARAKRQVSLVAFLTIGIYWTALATPIVMMAFFGHLPPVPCVGCGVALLAAVSPLIGGVVLSATDVLERPASADACGSCGYPRHGVVGVRCPECGQPWC